jgi:hypothetical protein
MNGFRISVSFVRVLLSYHVKLYAAEGVGFAGLPLSPAKRGYGILEHLHIWEPQSCGRGIEAAKVVRQRRDTLAVTV